MQDLVVPIAEERPWGSYRILTHGDNFVVKMINIKKGEQTSLQYHHKRDEYWYVLDGKILALNSKTTMQLQEGDEFAVRKKSPHRMYGMTDALVIEVCTGEYNEKDIVRLEDKYGRV